MEKSCKIEGCQNVYGARINLILLRPELNSLNKACNHYLEVRSLPFGYLDLHSAQLCRS